MESPSDISLQPHTLRRHSIGVVIPTFDAVNFLPQAIESVLNQTQALDEIVVVDDGSTDGTEAVAKHFLSRGVRYVKQANQGSAVARNTGVRMLSTDFVAFLDTDDQWLPNKTAVQADILMQQPAVGIVSGDQIFWDPERSFRKVRKFSHGRPAKRLLERLALKNVVGNPSMVMIRRSLFDRTGLFDPSLRFGDDWDMWLRIAAVSDIAFAGEPVAVYRWHSKNQSRSHQEACLRTYRQISRRAIDQSIAMHVRPLAYLYLLRHTVLFMHYKVGRSLLGAFCRRIMNFNKIFVNKI